MLNTLDALRKLDRAELEFFLRTIREKDSPKSTYFVEETLFVFENFFLEGKDPSDEKCAAQMEHIYAAEEGNPFIISGFSVQDMSSEGAGTRYLSLIEKAELFSLEYEFRNTKDFTPILLVLIVFDLEDVLSHGLRMKIGNSGERFIKSSSSRRYPDLLVTTPKRMKEFRTKNYL